MVTYSDLMLSLTELQEHWGEDGERVVENAFKEHKKISYQDFYLHCNACRGEWGNWAALVLSGMKELYPNTYNAIPRDMGPYALALITNTLMLCGVEEE